MLSLSKGSTQRITIFWQTTYEHETRKLLESWPVLGIWGFLRFNPFIPKSDQYQISPAASPEILHHTVWITWLFIAYSDERLPILTTSLVSLRKAGRIWQRVKWVISYLILAQKSSVRTSRAGATEQRTSAGRSTSWSARSPWIRTRQASSRKPWQWGWDWGTLECRWERDVTTGGQ